LAWHGDIDRMSAGAAASYAEDLLIIPASLGGATKDTVFICCTPAVTCMRGDAAKSSSGRQSNVISTLTFLAQWCNHLDTYQDNIAIAGRRAALPIFADANQIGITAPRIVGPAAPWIGHEPAQLKGRPIVNSSRT
jgi:hypothetical protein